jgi:hypothetical protein
LPPFTPPDSRSITPLILNLGIRCQKLVSLTLQLFCPRYPFNKTLGWTQSQSGGFGEIINHLALLEFETDRPACSMITMLTELSRLLGIERRKETNTVSLLSHVDPPVIYCIFLRAMKFCGIYMSVTGLSYFREFRDSTELTFDIRNFKRLSAEQKKAVFTDLQHRKVSSCTTKTVLLNERSVNC